MQNNVYEACGIFLTKDGHKEGTFEVPADERPSDLVARMTRIAGEPGSPVCGIRLIPNGEPTEAELVPLEDILVFVDSRFVDGNGNGGLQAALALNQEYSYGNSMKYIKEIPGVSLQVGSDYVVKGTILHQSDYSDPSKVLRYMESCGVPYVRIRDPSIKANGTSFSAGICLVRTDAVNV